MKTLISCFLIAFVLFSCTKNPNKNCCTTYDAVVNLSVRDSSGQDLLNSSSDNQIDLENVKIFLALNGETIEYTEQTNSDHPKGFIVYDHEDESRMKIYNDFPQQADLDEVTYYIEWSEADRDTIISEMRRSENSTQCIKVWYNGVLKWNETSGTERYFQVVK